MAVSMLIRRRNSFVLSGLICIPASIYLSYANSAGTVEASLIDVLFFACLLVPAVSTYLLASTFFSKTKAVLLAVVMFAPTIVFQIVILVGLWAGVNRAISSRKNA